MFWKHSGPSFALDLPQRYIGKRPSLRLRPCLFLHQPSPHLQLDHPTSFIRLSTQYHFPPFSPPPFLATCPRVPSPCSSMVTTTREPDKAPGVYRPPDSDEDPDWPALRPPPGFSRRRHPRPNLDLALDMGVAVWYSLGPPQTGATPRRSPPAGHGDPGDLDGRLDVALFLPTTYPGGTGHPPYAPPLQLGQQHTAHPRAGHAECGCGPPGPVTTVTPRGLAA